MCLPCEDMTTFAWERVRVMGLREDLGPQFGCCATWLEECDPPAHVAALMSAATAGQFLGLLFAVNEREEDKRELCRVARLQR